MKHLSKKELILFYYQDFSQKELNSIKNHLQACPSCQKASREIKETLSDFKFSQPHLAKHELDNILTKVRVEANQSRESRYLTLIKTYFYNFFRGLVLFFLKPKTAAVVVSVFVAVFAIYFYNSQANKFALQVSEVEFDLVADDEFDIFLDSYQFQSQSYIFSSSTISS